MRLKNSTTKSTALSSNGKSDNRAQIMASIDSAARKQFAALLQAELYFSVPKKETFNQIRLE
jgi:hypothetical protein